MAPAFLIVVTAVGVLNAADFDTSLLNLGRKFAAGIGLNANFVFTRGTDYPPIAEDVSFWCITP